MQLVLEMQVGGGDEYADHIHAAVYGSIHILLDGSGEGGDLGIQSQVADLSYGIHLCGGHDGKTSLNYLDADLIQPEGDIQLLIGAKDHSRHLLAIAQGDIADFYVQRRSSGQTARN